MGVDGRKSRLSRNERPYWQFCLYLNSTGVENEQGKGAADHAKGAVNEGVGKATGNERLREEGQLDKAKGDIR
jgi:uncharacterized protein YjbJ (UPF0337 family)